MAFSAKFSYILGCSVFTLFGSEEAESPYSETWRHCDLRFSKFHSLLTIVFVVNVEKCARDFCFILAVAAGVKTWRVCLYSCMESCCVASLPLRYVLHITVTHERTTGVKFVRLASS